MALPRRAAGAAVLAAVAVGGAAVTAGAGGGGAAVPTGPTATAAVRDLATTSETTGTVERVWQRTVSHTAATAGTTPTPPAGAGPDGAGPDGAGADEEGPSVLTSVAPEGSEVGTGTVLYTADDEPVAALVGTVPAWRTLAAGAPGGGDVRQLEEALVALGHGAGLAVDDEFSAATTAAVKRWETALGRARPDGVVEVGDLVVVEGAGEVLALEAAVGDPLEAGTAVLVLGSRAQHLVASVAAGEAAAWAAAPRVVLAWSDGSSSTATVAGTGREVRDGSVPLTVTLSAEDSARPTGAEATVTTVDAERRGAVAVPVSALVAGADGTPAVRRPTAPGRPDALVPVTTGMVAGTWVEVVSGLAAGDAVRLPG